MGELRTLCSGSELILWGLLPSLGLWVLVLGLSLGLPAKLFLLSPTEEYGPSHLHDIFQAMMLSVTQEHFIVLLTRRSGDGKDSPASMCIPGFRMPELMLNCYFFILALGFWRVLFVCLLRIFVYF